VPKNYYIGGGMHKKIFAYRIGRRRPVVISSVSAYGTGFGWGDCTGALIDFTDDLIIAVRKQGRGRARQGISMKSQEGNGGKPPFFFQDIP